MKVIGLTGGIGTGKSTVARFLAELGAVVIDADEVGHEFLESDSQVRQQIVTSFGEDILTPEGKVDRRKLGRMVFENPRALSCLNRIIHPRISEVVKNRLEDYRRGAGVVVIEAPLLVEAGWSSLVDQVWVTMAPKATVIKRLKAGKGLSRAEALARIRSQLPARERAKHADVVINNNAGLDGLKERVRELWQGLVI